MSRSGKIDRMVFPRIGVGVSERQASASVKRPGYGVFDRREEHNKSMLDASRTVSRFWSFRAQGLERNVEWRCCATNLMVRSFMDRNL